MGLIEWYVLFALTTACAASYELFWPVVRSLAITHPELQIVQSRAITMAVFFIMAFVLAPMTILPCLVPKMGVRFRHTLWETLIKQ